MKTELTSEQRGRIAVASGRLNRAVLDAELLAVEHGDLSDEDKETIYKGCRALSHVLTHITTEFALAGGE